MTSIKPLVSIKTRKTFVEEEQTEDQDKIRDRIKDSRFKQQRLPAWRPVPTIGSTIIIFILFGLIFITLGIILLLLSKNLKSISKRYDDLCQIGDNCTITIDINENMNQPIMIYYQLIGYFQNTRMYVKSKSIDQLRGKKNFDKDDCSPAIYNENLGKKESINKSDLNDKDIAYPCGLMAKTYFDDYFDNWAIVNVTQPIENITVEQESIAFKKDIEMFNISIDENKFWTDSTKEHFLVWMRPSGLPNPKKLWGRIKRNLNKGEKLNITVVNNYNVSRYSGEKKIVLSTTNVFGGKKEFMGSCYIISGSISIIFALIFFFGYRSLQAKEKSN